MINLSYNIGDVPIMAVVADMAVGGQQWSMIGNCICNHLILVYEEVISTPRIYNKYTSPWISRKEKLLIEEILEPCM